MHLNTTDWHHCPALLGVNLTPLGGIHRQGSRHLPLTLWLCSAAPVRPLVGSAVWGGRGRQDSACVELQEALLALIRKGVMKGRAGKERSNGVDCVLLREE